MRAILWRSPSWFKYVLAWPNRCAFAWPVVGLTARISLRIAEELLKNFATSSQRQAVYPLHLNTPFTLPGNDLHTQPVFLRGKLCFRSSHIMLYRLSVFVSRWRNDLPLFPPILIGVLTSSGHPCSCGLNTTPFRSAASLVTCPDLAGQAG